jgi:hypothetical protein
VSIKARVVHSPCGPNSNRTSTVGREIGGLPSSRYGNFRTASMVLQTLAHADRDGVTASRDVLRHCATTGTNRSELVQLLDKINRATCRSDDFAIFHCNPEASELVELRQAAFRFHGLPRSSASHTTTVLRVATNTPEVKLHGGTPRRRYVLSVMTRRSAVTGEPLRFTVPR